MLYELVEKIGDSIAPQLPLLMPFLSELLEGVSFPTTLYAHSDENHSVEDQCDKVLRLLQSKFGAEISDGFA